MEQIKKQIKRQTENINKVLYDDCFGVWIYNESKDNLRLLLDLNWEFLWENSDKEKVIDKEIVFDRIKAIEEESERRRGIR